MEGHCVNKVRSLVAKGLIHRLSGLFLLLHFYTQAHLPSFSFKPIFSQENTNRRKKKNVIQNSNFTWFVCTYFQKAERHMYMSIHIHNTHSQRIHIYIHTHTHTHTHTYIHEYIFTPPHKQSPTHTYMNIYSHTHKHIVGDRLKPRNSVFLVLRKTQKTVLKIQF